MRCKKCKSFSDNGGTCTVANVLYPDEVKHCDTFIIADGMKFDKGKNRVELLFLGLAKPLELVADILTYGANKYADNSWQNLDNGKVRYLGAALRHLLAYAKGERLDPESGKSHLAHAATNILFLIHFEEVAGE